MARAERGNLRGAVTLSFGKPDLAGATPRDGECSAGAHRDSCSSALEHRHRARPHFFRPISSTQRPRRQSARTSGSSTRSTNIRTPGRDEDACRRKGRRQPLFIEITNAGFDLTTICGQHHEKSAGARGRHQRDRWFAYVASLDEGDTLNNPAAGSRRIRTWASHQAGVPRDTVRTARDIPPRRTWSYA